MPATGRATARLTEELAAPVSSKVTVSPETKTEGAPASSQLLVEARSQVAAVPRQTTAPGARVTGMVRVMAPEPAARVYGVPSGTVTARFESEPVRFPP